MKWAAGLLLIVNLLLALWFMLRPGVLQERVDGGVLSTVAEMAELQVRSDAVCLFLGPVREGRLVRDIRNIHSGWQEIIRPVPGEIRYRVYFMPAGPLVGADSDGPGGLAGVRGMLEVAGMTDVESYQMLNGELAGAVSFGLFAGRENAQRLLVRLTENDIEAEMTEEPRLNEQPWLAELASNVPPRALSAMENLLLTRPEINIEENLCEMFALRE